MNAEKLEQVAQAIEANPDHFIMSQWVCGTTGCIAGWTCLIAECGKNEPNVEMFKHVDVDTAFSEAGEILDLSPQEKKSLFYATSWPSMFQKDWHDATTKKCRAKCAAARIRHLIKTGE